MVKMCTWGASNDVYTLLQSPAGLLGVGATNQQLTAQLGLREVLLEAVHEVVGLLGQVLHWLQYDCGGFTVV